MEFDHVGAHCDFEGCNQQDFLPFVCDTCHKSLCLMHRSYVSHNCIGATAKDMTSIDCPICGKSVKFDKSQDVNVIWDDHYINHCTQQPHKKAGVDIPPARCFAQGCRTVLGPSNTFTCSKCHQMVCLAHRIADDHNCVGPIRKEFLEKFQKPHPYSQQQEMDRKAGTKRNPNNFFLPAHSNNEAQHHHHHHHHHSQASTAVSSRSSLAGSGSNKKRAQGNKKGASSSASSEDIRQVLRETAHRRIPGGGGRVQPGATYAAPPALPTPPAPPVVSIRLPLSSSNGSSSSALPPPLPHPSAGLEGGRPSRITSAAGGAKGAEGTTEEEEVVCPFCGMILAERHTTEAEVLLLEHIQKVHPDPGSGADAASASASASTPSGVAVTFRGSANMMHREVSSLYVAVLLYMTHNDAIETVPRWKGSDQRTQMLHRFNLVLPALTGIRTVLVCMIIMIRTKLYRTYFL